MNEFKCDQTNIEDEARLERPIEVTSPDLLKNSVAPSWKTAE